MIDHSLQMPVYHVLFQSEEPLVLWVLKCFKVTEAEENPIYGGISLSLLRLHGERGGSVLGLHGMLLWFCVCGKVAPYNKQSSGTKDRLR